MDQSINLATHIFEFLEDDYQFDYHLKTTTTFGKPLSIITYYKDNTTVKISIHHQSIFFNLNLLLEKDNSFTITSVTDKLLYQSATLNEDEFKTAKDKLIKLL